MKIKTVLFPLAAVSLFIACSDGADDSSDLPETADSGVKKDGSVVSSDSSIGGDDSTDGSSTTTDGSSTTTDGSTTTTDGSTIADSSVVGDSSVTVDSAVTDSGIADSGIVTCATAGCSANATCSEDGGPASCLCNSGYSGDGKTCTNINDCTGDPCQNGGACVDGVNSYTCTCATGYSGAQCQTNADDCPAVNPCQNGGTCVDGLATYTCSCVTGYTGATCGTNIDDCPAVNPCQNGGSCVDGVNAYTCSCVNGYSGATCGTLPPKSCSEIKTANAAAADGVYTIDPDGVGAIAPLSVFCDMTTDGGGWTKILQYHNASYTPTASASGDITTLGTPAFAKVSDAVVNAIGAAIGVGRVYRIKGPTSPTGKKLFLFSTGTFTDTSVGYGLMTGSPKTCETATYASCVQVAATGTYIDSLSWGGAGNDGDRYFADYSGSSGVNCYNPSAAGVRCFNAGASTGHAFIADVSIWLK